MRLKIAESPRISPAMPLSSSCTSVASVISFAAAWPAPGVTAGLSTTASTVSPSTISSPGIASADSRSSPLSK